MDLTIRDETAVHIAVKNFQLQAFKVLLGWLRRTQRLHVLNRDDDEGNNVLHIAVSTLQPQIVKLLVKESYTKKNKNAKNLEGLTARDMAARLDPSAAKTQIEKILHQAGALKSPSLAGSSDSSLSTKLSLADFLMSPEKWLEKKVKIHHQSGKLTEEVRNVILVVAVLVATSTFQAILNPPEASISYVGLNSNVIDKDVCSNINRVLSLPAESNLVQEETNMVVDMALASKVDLGDLASQMKSRAKMADEGSLSHVSAVDKTRDCTGISNEIGLGVVESSLLVDSFIKSLSQPLKERPGICLEIALGHDPFGPLPIGPSSAGLKPSPVRPVCESSWMGSQTKLSVSSSPIISSSITQRSKKGKRKGIRSEGFKHCLLAGRFSGFARRIGQKGAISNKGATKSSRTGSAAIPVSNHSPELQQPFGIGFVQEVQPILQLGAKIGFRLQGSRI
ncbi:Ankyrin repeat-containing protein BDA1 [Camellia lanceoleosa]|uniref:Ankyrin repeat-containing protein BDA1 n=1 Tax=Camellia lanceoleosa TaxID=1840588 RepID=A0ACC0FFM0_9ERIC|nr:Ankyrin repeat-containing protein BDA1 [Camellia lanceoleosa]